MNLPTHCTKNTIENQHVTKDYMMPDPNAQYQVEHVAQSFTLSSI